MQNLKRIYRSSDGNLTELPTDFLTPWKAQDQAIDDRDQAVQTRVETSNNLYKDVI